MNSSSFSTLRLLVHPVEPHGSAQVSGSSRIGSGPEAFSRFRMSRRQASLALTQFAPLHLPGTERARARPGRHVGAVEREVFGRPDQRLQLDERPVVEGAPQLCRVVRRAEAAPHDQVGARGDRGDRVELEEAQMPHQIEQPGRSFGVEQLGLHGDPARVGPGELMDGGHAARLGAAADARHGAPTSTSDPDEWRLSAVQGHDDAMSATGA